MRPKVVSFEITTVEWRVFGQKELLWFSMLLLTELLFVLLPIESDIFRQVKLFVHRNVLGYY